MNLCDYFIIEVFYSNNLYLMRKIYSTSSNVNLEIFIEIKYSADQSLEK